MFNPKKLTVKLGFHLLNGGIFVTICVLVASVLIDIFVPTELKRPNWTIPVAGMAFLFGCFGSYLLYKE